MIDDVAILPLEMIETQKNELQITDYQKFQRIFLKLNETLVIKKYEYGL